MVAPSFPESGDILCRKLEAVEKFACLPPIEMRNYQTNESVLSGNGFSFKFEGEEDIIPLNICTGYVRCISILPVLNKVLPLVIWFEQTENLLEWDTPPDDIVLAPACYTVEVLCVFFIPSFFRSSKE